MVPNLTWLRKTYAKNLMNPLNRILLYLILHSDIWALGIVLFYMVSGFLPFRGNTDAELKKIVS